MPRRQDVCRDLRRAWFGEPDGLHGHAASCGACQRWVAAQERLARALAGLARLETPPELAGAVVAAFHPGYRQDRAVRSLRRLKTLPAPLLAPGALPPPGARVQVGALPRVNAPGVLDRLVAETLTRGAGGRVRSALERLPRQSAPRALAERVASVLRAEPAARRRRRLRSIGLAAAFALLAGASVLNAPLRPASDSEAILREEHAGFSFSIRRASDPSSLSGPALELVQAMTGSPLSAADPARRMASEEADR